MNDNTHTPKPKMSKGKKWGIAAASVLALAAIGSVLPDTDKNTETTAKADTPSSSTTAPAPAISEKDQTFLMTLDSENIRYTDTDALKLARSVCTVLDQGLNLNGAVQVVSYDGHYDMESAGFFAGAAVAAYCPEHAPAA
ncbi:DUF732 domain-containing protein [Nocardia heshunensis]